MKVLAIEIGRAAVLIPIDEVIPLDGLHPADVSSGVANRYNFSQVPDFQKSFSNIQEKGMEFQLGKFKDKKGKNQNIQSLTIFNFGIVVTAYSTEVAQEFLEDLFSWGQLMFGFRLVEEMNQFYFLSQLICQFDRSIDRYINPIADFSNSFANELNKIYNIKEQVPVNITNFSLDVDKTLVPEAYKQLSPFVIQRQTGKPFSSNRYFSQAPLHTDTHVKLLKRLEMMITDDDIPF